MHIMGYMYTINSKTLIHDKDKEFRIASQYFQPLDDHA